MTVASETALNEVAQLINQGQLEQARQQLTGLMAQYPHHAEIRHMLGLLWIHQGQFVEALNNLEQAVAWDDSKPAYYSNLGFVCLRLGRVDEAIAHCKRAIALYPQFAEAYNNLGLAFHEARQWEAACQAFQQALALKTPYATAQHNLARTLRAMGRAEEALPFARQAVTLEPGYGEALCNLGGLYLDLAQWEQARQVLLQALQVMPLSYLVHTALGALYIRLSDAQQAWSHLQQALALNPQATEAYYLAGSLAYAEGNYLKARDLFKQAVAIEPDYALAHCALGSAYAVFKDEVYDADAALESFEQALRYQNRLSIDHQFSLLTALAELHKDISQPDEATSWYNRALALREDGGVRVRQALLLPVIYDSIEALQQWGERYDNQIQHLADTPPPMTDPYQQIGVAHGFYRAYQNRSDTAVQATLGHLFSQWVPPVGNRTALKNSRPKIGFLSRYLYETHTIGKLMQGIVTHLNRDQFDVVLFTMESGQGKVLLEGHPTVPLPDNLRQAQQVVLNQGLDLLFYPEIGMDPLTYSLACSRLAPVQCVTWGHPVTSGIPNLDYFLSSKLIEPQDGASHYTEQLIQLEALPTWYEKPVLDEPLQTRSALGLPEDRHLYCCPQSLFKFHPDFDAVLAEILRRDSQGILVILAGSRAHWTQRLMARWQRVMPDVIERILVLPRMARQQLLQVMAQSDVILDTFYFGGGNSTYEALAMGTPMMTMPGSMMRGRVTLGCYRKMNVTDCIAENPESYIQLALKVGTDRNYRVYLKEQILAHNQGLYADLGCIAELEAFFTAVCHV